MIDTNPYWASHDAGTLPWLAVAGYLAAALLCGLHFRAATIPRERIFWLFAATTMLAMGINKQLDLQTMLTAMGRNWAREGGWYEQRRTFQAFFILAVAIVVTGGTAWLARLVRGLNMAVYTALAGLGLLALFILIRAASFHHLDVAMRTGIFGLKLHTVLELAGIAVVIAGARMHRRTKRPSPVSRH
jgi:hypothetical protein